MASAGGPGRPPRLRLVPLVAGVAVAHWAVTLAFATQPLVRPPRAAQHLAAAQGAARAREAPSAPQQGRPLVGASVALVACAALAAQRRHARSHGLGWLTARRAVVEEDLSIDTLMKKYGGVVKAIRGECEKDLEGFEDTYVLRYAIEHEGSVDAAVKNVKEVMAWRAGKGKGIVETAEKAVAEAIAGGGWDNAPVYNAAPHSATISKYLTSSQIVLVPLKSGDLCSCIRASAIDDGAMMDAVSVDQLVEFFLYAREVNLKVAEMRSNKTGRLVRLLAANDLTGVSKFPDSRFQEALTGSSKEAATLYPGLSGPTVILNLPGIVRLLVSFLTPLFPGAVQQKLKFARGPMAYLKDLSDVLKEPTRSQFIEDLDAVMNS